MGWPDWIEELKERYLADEASVFLLYGDVTGDRWQVDALHGEFEHAANLLRLSDQVVMQKGGDNPLHIVTESIRFEPDRDLVTSETSILLRSAQAQIEAERAVFDLSSRVYRFTKTRAIYRNDDS